MPANVLPPPPPSNAPAPALSKEEKIAILRQQARVLRDGALFDRGRIKNPNPAKQYCWVNVREERQVFFQSMGWDVCKDPNIGTLYWKPDEHRHRRADLVLYDIDFELWQAFEAQKQLDGLNLTGEAADQAFAANIARSGVRVYKPPVK
jgi:hypothetical protein